MSCRIFFTRSLPPSVFARSKCLRLHTSFHAKLKFASSSSLVQQRMLSTPSGTVPKHTTPTLKPGFMYLGPLASTFRRLKIFSLSSLVLSSTLAPIMFIVESNLPTTARVALASMIIGTSGLSTALVGWCAKPYVAKLRRLIPEENGGAEGIEMITFDILLRPRITRVYDATFLVQTKRPFAKWELAERVVLPDSKSIALGHEETVAETTDKDANIIGRWIVKWGENGEGICHEVGSIVRHFNVHEELLA